MVEVFGQSKQSYEQLRAMRDAGRLSSQQFIVELQKLRWQDGNGVWWTISPDGVFMYFDGRQWVLAQPVQVTPITSQAPARSPATQSRPTQTSRALTPLLAIIPSMVCGALWFLYTFLGVFKYEGIFGIDFITPLIIGGLPLMLWALKKPLDHLLLPFKPIIQSVPKPLRLGIALAVPLFLACGCSTLTPGGYLALNVSSFVGVMTASLLLRY